MFVGCYTTVEDGRTLALHPWLATALSGWSEFLPSGMLDLCRFHRLKGIIEAYDGVLP